MHFGVSWLGRRDWLGICREIQAYGAQIRYDRCTERRGIYGIVPKVRPVPEVMVHTLLQNAMLARINAVHSRLWHLPNDQQESWQLHRRRYRSIQVHILENWLVKDKSAIFGEDKSISGEDKLIRMVHNSYFRLIDFQALSQPQSICIEPTYRELDRCRKNWKTTARMDCICWAKAICTFHSSRLRWYESCIQRVGPKLCRAPIISSNKMLRKSQTVCYGISLEPLHNIKWNHSIRNIFGVAGAFGGILK